MWKSKLLNRIAGQKSPVLWLGAVRDMMARGQAYYGLINMPINLIILYSIRIETFKHYLPWINLLYMLMFIVTFMIIVVVVDWKIVYPSVIAHHQHQAWKHKSPAKKRFEEQRKRMAEQKKVMEGMNERMERVENILLKVYGDKLNE